jgi:hypothetical protein
VITINPVKLKEIENEKARQSRAAAFTAEYDPLAGKYARGEATQQELIDKAADIRARFPYQE